MAPAGAATAAGLGKAVARRLSRLPAVFGPAEPGPGGDSTAVQRAADVLQVPDPARRGCRVAHQKSGPAEARPAPAEIPDPAADDRFAQRAGQTHGCAPAPGPGPARFALG